LSPAAAVRIVCVVVFGLAGWAGGECCRATGPVCVRQHERRRDCDGAGVGRRTAGSGHRHDGDKFFGRRDTDAQHVPDREADAARQGQHPRADAGGGLQRRGGPVIRQRYLRDGAARRQRIGQLLRQRQVSHRAREVDLVQRRVARIDLDDVDGGRRRGAARSNRSPEAASV
jgi:hypothetical protein